MGENGIKEMEMSEKEMDLQEKFFEIIKILSGYSKEDRMLILDVAKEILEEEEEKV